MPNFLKARRMPWFWLFAACFAFSFAGCATVRPAERGQLAQPCMVSPFDGKRNLRAYENKVLQTLTGSELPAGAPGGGCGCVN